MYLCAVFQEVVIAGLQPCVTKLELKGTLITHDAGCVLIAGLTILAACGRTDTRRGSGSTHWDYLTSELTRRSVRLRISRRLRRRLVLETNKPPSIIVAGHTQALRPDEQDGAALEAMGTDAGSASLVIGHAGGAVMLGTENLIVNELANECAVLGNANDAPAGWAVIGRVKKKLVDAVLADTRCLGVSIRLR